MVRAAIITIVLCFGIAWSARAQGDIARGEKVYGEQKCALCHSIADKGNKKGPLDGVGSKLTPNELRLWMTDAKAMTEKTKATRKPEMKSYSLAKGDLDALVAYMSSLKK